MLAGIRGIALAELAEGLGAFGIVRREHAFDLLGAEAFVDHVLSQHRTAFGHFRLPPIHGENGDDADEDAREREAGADDRGDIDGFGKQHGVLQSGAIGVIRSDIEGISPGPTIFKT